MYQQTSQFQASKAADGAHEDNAQQQYVNKSV